MSKMTVKGIKGKKEIVHAIYDFGVDGGALNAVVDLFSLLANTIVHDCWMESETSVASLGAATIEMGITGGDVDGYLAAIALADLAADKVSGAAAKGALLTGGLRNKVTADSVVAIKIGTAAVTAGKVHFYLEVSDGY